MSNHRTSPCFTMTVTLSSKGYIATYDNPSAVMEYVGVREVLFGYGSTEQEAILCLEECFYRLRCYKLEKTIKQIGLLGELFEKTFK